LCRAGLGIVADVRVDQRPDEDLILAGQAAMGIFRHRFGHRQRAFDQRVEALGRPVARTDDRLALADKNPEAHVVALCAFHLFALAPTPLCPRDKIVQQIEGVVCFRQFGWRRLALCHESRSPRNEFPAAAQAGPNISL
jgi:hypothetical protein